MKWIIVAVAVLAAAFLLLGWASRTRSGDYAAAGAFIPLLVGAVLAAVDVVLCAAWALWRLFT